MASPPRLYPTDLTDAEWQILEPLIPAVQLGGRPPKWTRFGQARRLSKDYERLPETEEAMIYATMSRLMPRRLAPAA